MCCVYFIHWLVVISFNGAVLVCLLDEGRTLGVLVYLTWDVCGPMYSFLQHFVFHSRVY
uniref:Uncharacterized protein n=1 Tax=Anguilla anguilla TaxID=7936 RepID=A0A0E9T1G5_ANGAN